MERVFSNMGANQAHEQNNKVIKADGGAIGIFDDESALLEWAISGLRSLRSCQSFLTIQVMMRMTSSIIVKILMLLS